jgi:hypothetical protein
MTGLKFAGADFITPGTPFAFYSIGVGSNSAVAGAGAATNPFNATTIDASAILGGVGSPYTASSTGNAFGLEFAQNIYFNANEQTIHVDVAFSNNTASAINGVKYAVGIDPDQGIAGGAGFETWNTIGTGALASVTATSANGLSIAMQDVGGSRPAFASISWAWETSPNSLLSGRNDGNGDYTIALAYDLGDIAASEQVTLSYAYTLAVGPVPGVPEPETYAMLLAGLGLMGFIARCRKPETTA